MRARIVKYHAGDTTFEIDTEQLDVWDDGTGVRFWTQTDIPLNLHLKNGRATHVPDPFILPEMGNIAKGIFFDSGIHGQMLQIKNRLRWSQVKVITQNADGAPVNLPNIHLVELTDKGCHWINLLQCFKNNDLKIHGSAHVLRHLRGCLGATAASAPAGVAAVPAQAARSMPARV